MEAMIEKMRPEQILGAIGIVVGGVVALTLIVAVARYQTRLLADDTALKREKQQSDMTLRTKLAEKHGVDSERNLNALLTGTTPLPPASGDLDVQLATRLGMLEVSSNAIGSVLELAVRSDPARKQAIVEVIDRLQMEDTDPDAIVAAIKPLCQPAGKTPVHTEF